MLEEEFVVEFFGWSADAAAPGGIEDDHDDEDDDDGDHGEGAEGDFLEPLLLDSGLGLSTAGRQTLADAQPPGLGFVLGSLFLFDRRPLAGGQWRSPGLRPEPRQAALEAVGGVEGLPGGLGAAFLGLGRCLLLAAGGLFGRFFGRLRFLAEGFFFHVWC